MPKEVSQVSWSKRACEFFTLACFAVSSSASGSPSCEPTLFADLRAFVFPRLIETEGHSRALDFRDEEYQFDSLEEINRFNVSGQHLVKGTGHVVMLRNSPLGSPYWAQIETTKGANAFIQGLFEMVASRCASMRGWRLSNKWTVQQKALAQRDAFQTFSLTWFAKKLADSNRQPLADQILSELSALNRSLLLTPQEYTNLQRARPTRVHTPYTERLSYSLTENYLPRVAINKDPEWLELTNRGIPFRHFVHFRGRSFVKVFLRAENTPPSKLQDLHLKIFDKYGEKLHVTAVNEVPPKGMQSMLLRTFGVFLTDGTYRDSHWPEEVLVRAFKYDADTVDLSSSDFRGTFTYQYHLSREALSHRDNVIGLKRVLDDDEQFFGFHGDSPDPSNSLANTTTTMRINCIASHSELFYGINTIFSFERNPRFEARNDDNLIWSARPDGTFRLKTEEMVALSALWESPDSSGRGKPQ
jgi:hypothetical protein